MLTQSDLDWYIEKKDLEEWVHYMSGKPNGITMVTYLSDTVVPNKTNKAYLLVIEDSFKDV